MTGYEFELEYPTRDSFSVLLDTPGSRIARHLQLSYALNRQNQSLTGALITPWKQYEVEGDFSSWENLILAVVEDKHRPGYRLTIDTAPHARLVDKYLVTEPKLTLTSPHSEPLELSAIISRTPADLRADMTLKSRPLTGRVLLTSDRDATQATVQYRTLRHSRDQEVVFSHKSRHFPTADHLIKTGLTTSVEFTEFPALNTLVQSDVLWSPNNLLRHAEATFNVYRTDFRDESRKMVLHTLWSWAHSSGPGGRMNVTTGLSLRQTAFDFSIDHTQEWTRNMKYFDGRVETHGALLGRKSVRLAWDNRWAGEKRLTAEADLGVDTKFLNMRGVLRDQSAFMSRSYPFEVTMKSSEALPLKLSGEITGIHTFVFFQFKFRHKKFQKASFPV